MKMTTQQPADQSSTAAKRSSNYTWFLSVQISNSDSHKAFKSAQQVIVQNHPNLLETLVPVSKSHITLFCFNLDSDDGSRKDDKLTGICQTLETAIAAWLQNATTDGDAAGMKLKLNEVCHFDHQVIFVKPELDKCFGDFWQTLSCHLLRDGFINEKSSVYERFNPHVTLCKLSRVKWWRAKKAGFIFVHFLIIFKEVVALP